MQKVFKYLGILTLLALGIFLLNNVNPSKQTQNDVDVNIEVNEEEDEEKNKKIDKQPAKENANYFEEIVVIDKQPMYYSYPLEIDLRNPPELIVYSHGQLQRIVNDKDDIYMQDLREYAEFFTTRGYAFSASNQHDDNWGQAESLQDISNSIEWFENNELPLAEKIHIIGFSMGGLAAINFALENYNSVNKIVLLAPTPRLNLTQEDIAKFMDIPIKIFHGDADVNIPLNNSLQYKTLFEQNNKEVDLEIIPNAAHYDVEFTLEENIKRFFLTDTTDIDY